MSPAAPETRIHHFHSISAQSSAVSGYGGLRYGSGLVRARREDRFTVNLSGTAGICPVSSETELFCFYCPLFKAYNLFKAYKFKVWGRIKHGCGKTNARKTGRKQKHTNKKHTNKKRANKKRTKRKHTKTVCKIQQQHKARPEPARKGRKYE